MYFFVAVYWTLVWRGIVRWTLRRRWGTVLAGLCAIAVGWAVGTLFWMYISAPSFGAMLIGGGIPPIIWVLTTVLLWRETADERIARLSAAGTDAAICPNCGYTMTGLPEARCPECGSAFTLDQLLSSQPCRDRTVLVDVKEKV